jgi:hypothetical protein
LFARDHLFDQIWDLLLESWLDVEKEGAAKARDWNGDNCLLDREAHILDIVTIFFRTLVPNLIAKVLKAQRYNKVYRSNADVAVEIEKDHLYDLIVGHISLCVAEWVANNYNESEYNESCKEAVVL